jgi:hypothetical protein
MSDIQKEIDETIDELNWYVGLSKEDDDDENETEEGFLINLKQVLTYIKELEEENGKLWDKIYLNSKDV